MRNFIVSVFLIALTVGAEAGTTSRVIDADLIQGIDAKRNYIKNSGAETNTLGCAAYADAAATSPVDGTGGSPNITITRTTTNPLSGVGSFLITKDAANRQGQGVACSFTIDNARLSKPIFISFDYEVASGTYDAGSDTTDPDLTAWVYGPTDGTPTLTQLAPHKVLGCASGAKCEYRAWMQTAATGSVYRLILHETKTGTSAYTFKADNLTVSPSIGATAIKETSPAILAIGAFNPVDLSGTTTDASAATVNQLGNSGITFTTNGTATTITSSTSLTSGTVQANFSETGWYLVNVTGQAAYANATTFAELPMTYGGTATAHYGASPFYPFALGVGTTNGSGTDSFYVYVSASGQTFTVRTQYRVTGGGSTGQRTASGKISIRKVMSVDGGASSHVVAMRAYRRAGSGGADRQTVANNSDVAFVPNFLGYDTGANYSTSTGEFTCPENAIYHVSGAIYFVGLTANTGQVILYPSLDGASVGAENMSAAQSIGGSTEEGATVAGDIRCNAGSKISLRTFQNNGGSRTAQGFFSVHKVNGMTQPQVDQSVNAKYTSSATSAMSGTAIHATKVFDSHNAYNTSTGAFVCPINGTYRVGSGFKSSVTAASNVSDLFGYMLKKDGVNVSYVAQMYSSTTSAMRKAAQGSTTTQCNAGQSLTLVFDLASVNGHTLSGDADSNFVTFERIGN